MQTETLQKEYPTIETVGDWKLYKMSNYQILLPQIYNYKLYHEKGFEWIEFEKATKKDYKVMNISIDLVGKSDTAQNLCTKKLRATKMLTVPL